MEYFQNLEPLLKAFWYIAVPVSVVFVIQTIMTFMGGDASDGVEADFDGDMEGHDTPFQLFSLRNLTNFLLGFSWTGISFHGIIENTFALVSLALLVGVSFVALFFFMLKQIYKLSEDNSFNIKYAINKTGQVYLTIPAQNQGKGKVMVSVNGTTHELDAITSQDKIESGAMIIVKAVVDGNLLSVEKI